MLKSSARMRALWERRIEQRDPRAVESRTNSIPQLFMPPKADVSIRKPEMKCSKTKFSRLKIKKKKKEKTRQDKTRQDKTSSQHCHVCSASPWLPQRSMPPPWRTQLSGL